MKEEIKRIWMKVENIEEGKENKRKRKKKQKCFKEEVIN